MENPLRKYSWGQIIAGAAIVTALTAACIFALPTGVAAVGSALSGSATAVGGWVAGAAEAIAGFATKHTLATLGIAAVAGAVGAAVVGKSVENAAIVNSLGGGGAPSRGR